MMPLFAPLRSSTSQHPRLNHQSGRALAVSAVILVFLISCASTPHDRVALNTLKSLRTTAESAVSVFKAGRAQVPPLFTAEQEVEARSLYAKYLAADKIAAEALLIYKQGDDLTAMMGTVSKAVNDLVAFVNSLKAKP